MDGLAGWPGALLAAILGLVFGSFATMLSHRFASGGDVLGRRSACPACGVTLAARDLVPLLSWFMARGRCRHCGVAIGWRYPAIEAATALAFLGAWWSVGGIGPAFAVLAALAVVLVAMSAVDLARGWLPDPLQLAAALLALVWRLALPGDLPADALDMAVGAGILGGIGLALRWGFRLLRGREGFGLGDVKLLAVAGLWLGFVPAPMLLVLAGLGGALLASGWRMAGLGREFPLGPPLALALYVILLVPWLGTVLA